MKIIGALMMLLLSGSFTKPTTYTACQAAKPVADSIPKNYLGNFKDDYGIAYTVTDSLFTQHPGIQYHILRWNLKERYFIAKNDAANPSEQGLYSRIDYMDFTNMDPFTWGFCLTVYNAGSDLLAETTAVADRQNPKKGCGGFPFSRMKRIEK